jgi:hypothetical protein
MSRLSAVLLIALLAVSASAASTPRKAAAPAVAKKALAAAPAVASKKAAKTMAAAPAAAFKATQAMAMEPESDVEVRGEGGDRGKRREGAGRAHPQTRTIGTASTAALQPAGPAGPGCGRERGCRPP